MISGEDPVIFTHIVLVLHDSKEVISFIDQVFHSQPHSGTSVIIISDLVQKREVMAEASAHDYDKLTDDRRLRFVFKPLKPSKFAVIFDPQKEREISTDRNENSAQQVAVNQKMVFDDMKRRLGNKGHRVLLVEDNKINQTVSRLPKAWIEISLAYSSRRFSSSYSARRPSTSKLSSMASSVRTKYSRKSMDITPSSW